MDPHREFTMDGETFARRRDRRVSFAETTAVHVFDRDDSSGTPTKNDSNATLSPCSDSGGDDESSVDTREDGDDEDEEGMAVPPVRFIRDMTDSSPGSASAASVASNDDENFFGPVSMNFMNSGISDSGISEDNNNVAHDITLDSTAFSLHYRNIGGDERSANSAGSRLATPTTDNITPFVRGSINEPSGANDTVSRLKFSGGISSSGLGDFSMVENNSSKFDYGMSASLNNLLRRVDNSLKTVSPVAFETVSPPVDVSMDQNSEGAKLLTVEVSCPTDVSVNQNGDSDKPLTMEVSHPIEVIVDQNDDFAKVLTGEISQPIDVSMDQNYDGPTLRTGEVCCTDDVSLDQNGDDGKLLTGEVSHPIDVSIDKSGDGTNLVTGEVSNPSDVSVNQNGDNAKLPTWEVSRPIEVLDHNGDGAKLLTGEISQPMDVSVNQNDNGATLLTGEVSCTDDVSMDQNGDGAKLLTGEVSHPIDDSVHKSGDGTKLVTGEVSHPSVVSIDNHPSVVSMDKNVKYDELPILGTHASDNERVNEKYEDHPENMYEDAPSKTIPYSPKVTAIFSPQHTISLQVQSTISLSSSRTTAQHPGSEVPMVTPKGALDNAPTSSHAKMAQLGETCQLPSIGSELFKHSERISAIKESILREFPKGNITLSRLNFENENMPPSQSPVETVVPNQEFDLEGRKRKWQLLGSVEDHPAKHAKPLARDSSTKQQEHGERPQNYSLDWSKVVADMSEITKILVSPSVQKLTIQELDLFSGMMGKLQMARKYERLSAFLRNNDSTDQQQRRLAEAISLHDKLLYKKAELELNRLKLNKIHSKAELVRQRDQECRLLKSKISDLCSSSSKVACAEYNCFPTNSISVTQEKQDRLISKRQALKAIERNIINLGASLRASCKITDDLGCDDIIAIARKHLKMKNTQSTVQQDAKLCKLHDIIKDDKSCEIVLDYNFLFQRFKLGITKSSSILVNTMLNKTKIIQAFRGMNAYSAIEFVFRSKFTDHNVDSLKHVRQETLEMSLLLGNVIDVLHEVQAAKREHLNLISTNFNCKLSNPNVLELQLSFMNFKWGKKVVLSLDLSDLKFAMYPSEPTELHIEIDRTMTTFDEVLLKEMTAMIQSLPAGRLMVSRLCRTVSQLVHSSST